MLRTWGLECVKRKKRGKGGERTLERGLWKRERWTCGIYLAVLASLSYGFYLAVLPKPLLREAVLERHKNIFIPAPIRFLFFP